MITDNRLKKSLENSLKKPTKTLSGRGNSGNKRSRAASILAEGVLAAALWLALAGCDGLNGAGEDISNNPADFVPLLESIKLNLNDISPSNEVDYSMGDTNLPVLKVSASLKNASALLKFQWYKLGGNDDGTAEPLGNPVLANPNTIIEYLPDVTKLGDSRYFVKAYYPANGTPLKEEVSESVLVSVGPSPFPSDTDGDGYPDEWEIEHAAEGYNPYVANSPYGIDLSGIGAPPMGVRFNSNTGAFEVTGSAQMGVMEYQVYYSDNLNHGDPGYITLNAPVDTAPVLGNVLYESTAELDIASDVSELHIDSYQESGASFLVENRDPNDILTIHLEGVSLWGGAPIDFEVDKTAWRSVSKSNCC